MENTKHQNIVTRIARIREATSLFIEEELGKRGLTGIVPAHGGVFAHLFRQDHPIPITDLVKKTGRAKSTVTGIVKTLERHGYVYRIASSEDARSVLIALTPKGLGIKDDFEDISQLLLGRVYGDMGEHDKETLNELLTRIENNLNG